MKKVIYVLLVVVLLVGLGLSCAPAPDEVIEIDALTFLPINHAIGGFIPPIIDKLNQAGEGKVVWKLIGGPEVITGLDQFNAVSTGVVDAVFNVVGLYTSDVPGAYSTVLSRLKPWEERESGFYDLINELHQEKNTYSLGRWHWMGFYLWTIDPVESFDDLAGLKMRGSGMIWGPWYERLGVTMVEIPAPEAYAALQQGLVDGVGWPAIGILDFGWGEVLKYGLDHEALSNSNALTLVNLDVWNKIPGNIQKKLIKAYAEVERDMVAYFDNLVSQEKQKARDAGITFIKLSPADGKRLVDAAYEGGWAKQKELTPELYDELRRLLGH